MIVTHWLVQHEHVSYLAFAIIREYELLAEILSSCLPYGFSPESAAALSSLNCAAGFPVILHPCLCW